MSKTRAQLINLWRNRKEIWSAMHTIGNVKFTPHHSGWHHWVFQQGTIYKDGVEAPDEVSLEMWIKNPTDTKKYTGKTK